jgi:tetratricopeptide (TPR) repeat protein
MIQIIQMLNLNEEKVIPEELFDAAINDLSKEVCAILGILRGMDNAGTRGEKLSPKEVLATFDLAFSKAIQSCLKYVGKSAQTQNKRERNGLYPFDNLPVSASIHLSRRMEEAVKYIKDDRAEQSALAMLVSLGEATQNIDQMQRAVDSSLEITEGKVTEFTPPPIPEALAAAYQVEGNLDKALTYYELALDGIRTFVMREKTDAIVLNACLIMARNDKKAALRTAFEFSPFFSDTQLNIVAKAGRSLLVQQCEVWAKELGLNLSEARQMLTKSSDETSLRNKNVNIIDQTSNKTTEIHTTIVLRRTPGNQKKHFQKYLFVK